MKGERPNHIRNEIRLPDDIGHGHKRRIYSLRSMVFVSVPENQRRGDSGKFMISQHSASGQFASDRENALGPRSFGQDTRSWLQFRPGPVVCRALWNDSTSRSCIRVQYVSWLSSWFSDFGFFSLGFRCFSRQMQT